MNKIIDSIQGSEIEECGASGWNGAHYTFHWSGHSFVFDTVDGTFDFDDNRISEEEAREAFDYLMENEPAHGGFTKRLLGGWESWRDLWEYVGTSDADIEDALARDARIRVMQEDALDHLETSEDGTGVNKDYMPSCPICGMGGTTDELGDNIYACGHYTGTYSVWHDPDENLYEEARAATHSVTVNYDLGGDCQWFFAKSPEGLDDIMTASEVEQRYGLGKGTVRVECNRNSIPARRSAGTWLLRRVDAEARWGKRS